MQIEKLRRYALQGDIVVIGGTSIISCLIKNVQAIQTLDHKPSKWSHTFIYLAPERIVESTMDFEPYQDTGKRLDNGVQYNFLHNYADVKTAMLMHFHFTDEERRAIVSRADEMVQTGFRYPILGLIGTMLSFWVMPWMKSNPLGTRGALYCSSFVQEVYKVVGIDFDKDKTSRNTSPEMISQCKRTGLMIYDLSEEVKKDEPVNNDAYVEQRPAFT